MTDRTADVQVCPVCHEFYEGDLPSFEAHVDAHFDNESDPANKEDSSKSHDLLGQSTFSVECEAEGCGEIVNLDDMAEHMDRHLAEQLQSGEARESTTSKRPIEDEGQSQNKRGKSALGLNYEPSHEPPQEPPERKRTGQTTMDGFITLSSAKSPLVSSSRSPQFTFMSDKFPVAGTFSLIPKAKMLLETSLSQGVTKIAYLADPSVAFFQGDRTDWGWGCGYRNIQMMLSYVVQQQCSISQSRTNSPSANTGISTNDPPIIPTIPQIQQQLEYAWSLGFDPVGAQQLGHKVEGTKKWVGTTEAWSVLSSLGVRCSILDFHTPTGPGGMHPAMLTAVYNYFREPPWSPLSAPSSTNLPPIEFPTDGTRIIQTAKPPLYMQHQGHSKTIIGIEISESGIANLLVFDPGRWLHKAIPDLREESLSRSRVSLNGSSAKVDGGLWNAQYLLKAFRFEMHSRNSKSQYQLLGVSGLYNDTQDRTRHDIRIVLQMLKQNAALSIGWDDQEYETSKDVTSTRVP